MKRNVLVLGHARHGKDTFAELLLGFNPELTFSSSSWFLCESYIYPILKEKYNYKTPIECFEDRKNKRKEWFQLIESYAAKDKTRVARELLRKNKMYVGLRSNEEYQACLEKDIFTYIFWVDASDRKPLESKNSFNISFDEKKMWYIDNNSGLKNLEIEAYSWSQLL